MDSGNNIALAVAIIAAIGPIWMAWKTPGPQKGDTATTNDAGNKLSVNVEKRRRTITVVMISVALLLGVIAFLFLRAPSGSERAAGCARLSLKRAQNGLAEQLRGVRQYLTNDFHWPSKLPLDVGEVHKSMATQKKTVEDALTRFRDTVDFSGKAFGKSADALCTWGIGQSNEVRNKILIHLSNPPNGTTALIALKFDLLSNLDRLILELDPRPQPKNGAPKPVKPLVNQ